MQIIKFFKVIIIECKIHRILFKICLKNLDENIISGNGLLGIFIKIKVFARDILRCKILIILNKKICYLKLASIKYINISTRLSYLLMLRQMLIVATFTFDLISNRFSCQYIFATVYQNVEISNASTCDFEQSKLFIVVSIHIYTSLITNSLTAIHC